MDRILERVGAAQRERSAREANFFRILLDSTRPVRPLQDGEAVVRPVSGRYRKIARLMAATDGISVLVALMGAYLVRFATPVPAQGYLALTLLAPIIWIIVFHLHRLYAPQHLSAWEEFRRIISSTGIGVVVLVMASYWTKAALSRLWLAYGWFAALILVLAVRRVWRWYIARQKADGRLAYRTLIVGLNEEAAHLATSLRPADGFVPVGCVCGDRTTSSLHDLPVMGDLDGLANVIIESQTECLFVASSAVDGKAMSRIIQTARQTNVEIRMSANLPEILSSRLTIQPYGDVMALSLNPVRLSKRQTAMKRGFDLVGAGIGIVLLSPVLLLVSVAVKLSSRGPILFRQERVTKGGRVFKMYKFRTMTSDADHLVVQLDLDTSVPFFKLQDDPRLTKVGAFLRRSSLDELPQLFNVIKGDMSLVGPRPLPVDQVRANLEILTPRHEVPAGVTGWWQVQGRSSFTPEDAIRMDLFYIENWSLGLDLFILLKTFGVVAARRGAF